MSKVLDDPAASSPASSGTDTQPSFNERSSKWTPEQRHSWELTGKEPDPPSPATKEGAAAGTEKEVQNPAPETAPDTKEEPKRSRTDARKDRKIGELSAQLRQAQRELDELKKGASSKASTDDQPKTREDGRPVPPEEPEITDYQTIEEYNKDRKQYKIDRAKYEDLRDEWNRNHWESRNREATQQSEVEKQQQARVEGFDKRANDFEKALPDFDEKSKGSPSYQKAFNEVKDTLAEAKPDIQLINAILDSDLGPAVILHFGTHTDDLDRILELPLHRALVEFGKVEVQLAKAPKPKTVSSAPHPPAEVGGTDTGNDGPKVGSKAWIDAENKRDIARMTG